jgi:hypothetical protein
MASGDSRIMTTIYDGKRFLIERYGVAGGRVRFRVIPKPNGPCVFDTGNEKMLIRYVFNHYTLKTAAVINALIIHDLNKEK